MKTIKKLTFLFFMALAITACSKDDDNNGDADGGGQGGAGDEYFRASVDGNAFAADTDLATLIGGSLVTNNGMTVLSAQGSTNSGDFINFNILNFNGPGTYVTADDLTNPNGMMYGELQGQTVNGWVSNGIIAISGAIRPGEITVTAQDDNGAEGTFSFEGYNGTDETVKTITNGEFKVVFDN
ncbi:MAG: hypothetical protein K0U54_00620 [Bacteroidetes bacterium]|nr:hypothetical protein [Bacteroidota bacterium]